MANTFNYEAPGRVASKTREHGHSDNSAHGASESDAPRIKIGEGHVHIWS